MAAAPSRAYQYTPLHSNGQSHDLRVLLLLPGPVDTEISCDIQHASFGDAPSYEALSYTWGDPKSIYGRVPGEDDPDRRYTITISQRTHSIRYNLMCALKHFRYEDRSRALWVDALCINQEDKDERSEQVRHMSWIFSGATRVLAWLGEPDGYVDLAFDSLEELCWATKAMVWSYCSRRLGLPASAITDRDFESVIERERDKTQDDLDPNRPFKNIEDKKPLIRALLKAFNTVGPMNFDEPYDLGEAALATFSTSRTFARYLVTCGRYCSEGVDIKARLRAFEEVFSHRAYWRRLWIVQEILCGPEVTLVCGSRTIDFNAFSIVRLVLHGLEENSGGSLLFQVLDFKTIRLLTYALYKAFVMGIEKLKETTRSLAKRIALYTWNVCSDPRDNIYALLDISSPIDISVDYHISVKDLFILATKEIIRQEKNLDIILPKPNSMQAELSKHCLDPTMPSWVPKFDQRLSGGRLVSFLRPRLYDAGGPLDRETVIDDAGVLEVRGYFLKEITEVYHFPIEHGKEKIPDTVAGLTNHLRLDLRKENYPFWNTLVLGAYTNNTGNWKRLSENAKLEQEFRTDVRKDLSTMSHNGKFISRLVAVELHKKKFCMLPDGIMALVNGSAEVGDCVFVARGASAPLVIRPTDTEFRLKDYKSKGDFKTTFKFVGGAYVYGIMSREYVEEQSKYNPVGDRVHII